MLEFLPGELPLLKALQPGGQGLGAVHPHPYRQGVDEHADHGFDAGQGGRAAGDHAAEDDVLLAAVAAEEHGPGSQSDGLESHLIPHRERLELRGDLAGDLKTVLGGGGSSRRPCRRVDAQRRGSGEPRELPAPERLRPRRILLSQPGDVVAERTRRQGPPYRRYWRYWRYRLGTLPQRRVDGPQLADQEGERPAVEEQVMESPDEAVLVAEADQGETHQRRPVQGQRSLPVALARRFEAALLLLRGEVAPVQLLPGERDVFAHHLPGLVETLPEKYRAQHPVARDEPLPGLAEQPGIEIRRQGAGDLADIDVGLGRQQTVKQHAALERRQGIDVFDVLHRSRFLVQGIQSDSARRAASLSKLLASSPAWGKSEEVKTSSLFRPSWISCRKAPA